MNEWEVQGWLMKAFRDLIDGHESTSSLYVGGVQYLAIVEQEVLFVRRENLRKTTIAHRRPPHDIQNS